MIARFFSNERGATSIEYALIAVMVSVAIIGSVSQWSDEVVGLFDYVQGEVGQ